MIVFTPPFLMRSHHLSSANTGFSLGIIYGIAGVIGVMLGGVVSDGLGKREPRWRFWAPGLALLIAAPFTLAAWLVRDSGASVMLMSAARFANVFYMAPVFVAAQTLVPVEQRALASGFLLFFNSLIGVSLGPLAVGALSDWLHPLVGLESLRYALCFVVITQVWASVHFALAAHGLRREGAAG